jgi:hypothetical protein
LRKVNPSLGFWARIGGALLPPAGRSTPAKALLLVSILAGALGASSPPAVRPALGAPHPAVAWPEIEVAAPELALEPMSDRGALPPELGTSLIALASPRPEPDPKLHPLPDPEIHLFEPAGCLEPPADYGPVQAGPRMLSARTLAMLEHAARLYGGRLDITGAAILPAPRHSLGQDAGHPAFDPSGEYGIVDLAVVDPADGRVMYEEVDALIRALRAAGFAAWLRDRAEISPKSEAYVHAVAIGDRQLSEAARNQLYGPNGYFRGGRGLEGEAASFDPHGGPLLCRWMAPAETEIGVVSTGLPLRWEARLKAAAEAFLTSDPESTAELARSLGYLSSNQEDPSNMCGPLSAAILREAGLLPSTVGPVAALKSYWLASPVNNGRPWSLFPADRYEVNHFATGIDRFDFSAWPLMPGDFVYTYAGRGSFSHMFVVTEVDPAGRAYTVTNQLQPDGGYLVQRVLLYDPRAEQEGVLHSRCAECGTWRRRTGLGGFDVLRRRNLAHSPGTEVLHTVLPGETLPQIAGAYGSTLAAVTQLNPGIDPLVLQVGEPLRIPVNLPLPQPEFSAPTASLVGAGSLAALP